MASCSTVSRTRCLMGVLLVQHLLPRFALYQVEFLTDCGIQAQIKNLGYQLVSQQVGTSVATRILAIRNLVNPMVEFLNDHRG